MRTIFAMSLALVVGFCSTSEGAAVLPQLDGGPFDGVTNILGFTVSGTYNAQTANALTDNDTFTLTYTLTSNSGGPDNLPLTVVFNGTVSNVTTSGPDTSGNITSGTGAFPFYGRLSR